MAHYLLKKYYSHTRSQWGVLWGLILSACGGGGGGGGPTTSGTETTSKIDRTGYVYDGPIENADVYIDVDDDGVLDKYIDVFVGRSDKRGQFKGTIQKIYANKRYIVDLTIAVDHGEDPDSKDDNQKLSGIWVAPKGASVVSAFTHLISAGVTTSQQIQSAIPNFDPMNDNPYGVPITPEKAIAYEKARAVLPTLTKVVQNNRYRYDIELNIWNIAVNRENISKLSERIETLESLVKQIITGKLVLVNGNFVPPTPTNTPTTGDVVITGAPREGERLTADTSALRDVDGIGTFTYQWMADGHDIGGARQKQYELKQADVGKVIRVKVTHTDSQGTTEPETISAPTDQVKDVNNPQNVPPTPTNNPTTGDVVITGAPREGERLTADTSALRDVDGIGTFTYQWMADGQDIAGAEAKQKQYELKQADVGKVIRVKVTHTDAQGTTEPEIISAPTDQVENVNNPTTGDVVITGAPREGERLTADTSALRDVDGIGTFTYQWMADGQDIAGAEAKQKQYELKQADVGKVIRVKVTHTDAHGTTEPETISAPTDQVKDVNNPQNVPPTPTNNPTPTPEAEDDLVQRTSIDLNPSTSTWSKSSTNPSRNNGYFNNQDFHSRKLGAVAEIAFQVIFHGSNIPEIDDNVPTFEVTSNSPANSRVKFKVVSKNINREVNSIQHRYLFELKFDPASVPQLDDHVFGTHNITIKSTIHNVTTTAEFTLVVARDLPLSPMMKNKSFGIVRQVSEPRDSKLPFFEGEELTLDITEPEHTSNNPKYEWQIYTRPDEFDTYTHLFQTVGTSKNFTPSSKGRYLLKVTNGDDEHTYWFYVLQSPKVPPELSTQDSQTINVEIFENHPDNKLIADLAGSGAFRLAPSTVNADNNLFRIDVDTGKIWLKKGTMLNFEASRDENKDGTYSLKIIRHDNGRDHEINLEITVKNLSLERVFEPEMSSFTIVLEQADSFNINDYKQPGTVEKLLLKRFVSEDYITYPIQKSLTDDPLIITWSIVNQDSILRSDLAFRAYEIISPTGEKRTATMRNLLNPFTDQDELDAFRDQVQRALAEFEKAANIKFVEVADNHQTAGDLRLLMVDQFVRNGSEKIGAWQLGDKVVFSPQSGYQSPNASSITILHEIGHFLGLSHPFEKFGDPHYSSRETVMSYANFPFNAKLMQADINVLQFLFGAPPGGTSQGTRRPDNNPTTGDVVITGAPREGERLTADTSALRDVDGIGTFTYQWMADGHDIGGARQKQYELKQADVGKVIRVKVTHTDAHGTTEPETISAPTDQVKDVNNPQNVPPTPTNNPTTGDVVITGAPREGERLTADTSALRDVDGIGTFTYQWMADGHDIGGARQKQYELKQADVGKVIRVKVTHTDAHGTTEPEIISNSVTTNDSVPSSQLNEWLNSQQVQEFQSASLIQLTWGENRKTPIFTNEPITASSNIKLAAGERLEFRWFHIHKGNPDHIQTGTTFTPTVAQQYKIELWHISASGENLRLPVGNNFIVRKKPAVNNSEISVPETGASQPIPVQIYENHPADKMIADLADLQGDSRYEFAASPDNRFFNIDPKTGAIWFRPTDSYQLLDRENPQDANRDHIYDLQIVRHTDDGRTVINLSVNVRDLQNEKTNQQDFDKVDLPSITYSDNKDRPIIPGQPSFNELVSNIEYGNIASNILSRGDNTPWEMPPTGPLIITYSIVNGESILPDHILNRLIDIHGYVKEELKIISKVTLGTLLNKFTDATEIESMRMMVRDALDEFEKAANLKFVEVADNQNVSGDLRITLVSNKPGTYAATSTVLNSKNPDPFVIVDSGAWTENIYPTKQLLLHEIGHFLRLFYPSTANNDPLSRSDKTVMSFYSHFPVETQLQPADIAALQFMYGAPEDEEIDTTDVAPAIL